MNSDDQLIQLAVIGAPHGVKGELRVKSYTDDPQALGDYGPLVTNDGRSFIVKTTRPAKEVVIVRFEGVDTREKAEAMKGLALHVKRSSLPQELDEDEFYHVDLIGLAAFDEQGEPVGKIISLHDFGGGEMLEIKAARGPVIMVPFTRAAVPTIDFAAGRVVVDSVAGGLVTDPEDEKAASTDRSKQSGKGDASVAKPGDDEETGN